MPLVGVWHLYFEGKKELWLYVEGPMDRGGARVLGLGVAKCRDAAPALKKSLGAGGGGGGGGVRHIFLPKKLWQIIIMWYIGVLLLSSSTYWLTSELTSKNNNKQTNKQTNKKAKS